MMVLRRKTDRTVQRNKEFSDGESEEEIKQTPTSRQVRAGPEPSPTPLQNIVVEGGFSLEEEEENMGSKTGMIVN